MKESTVCRIELSARVVEFIAGCHDVCHKGGFIRLPGDRFLGPHKMNEDPATDALVTKMVCIRLGLQLYWQYEGVG